MFQNLTSNWSDRPKQVSTLIVDWLRQMGDLDIDENNLTATMLGKVVVIPHVSWAWHGFSGSSLPTNVKLDYSNSISFTAKSDEVDILLEECHDGIDLVSEAVVHYGSNNSLCGIHSATLSQDMTKVDCPYCVSEVMIRVMPESDIPS